MSNKAMKATRFFSRFIYWPELSRRLLIKNPYMESLRLSFCEKCIFSARRAENMHFEQKDAAAVAPPEGGAASRMRRCAKDARIQMAPPVYDAILFFNKDFIPGLTLRCGGKLCMTKLLVGLSSTTFTF
jgi:hypothetical protein